MLIKIPGGTPPQAGQALCDTCRHARIIRGRRLEEELVFCDAGFMRSVQITFKVTSCSEYSDANEASYHELLEKAWILRPAAKGRAAGFVRASDLRGEEARRLLAHPPDD